MAIPDSTRSLLDLLQHPGIWRGRSLARSDTLSTGFRTLDDALPGGGWPRVGLVEILTPRFGLGELRLFVPALARLSRGTPARWLAWIAPPYEPYAPALEAAGFALERQLVVRAESALWAMEQALASATCDAVLCWPHRAPPRNVRRLQLATEKGRSLGILFRELARAREASPVGLRLRFTPRLQGARLDFLKSRGGARGGLDLCWSDAA